MIKLTLFEGDQIIENITQETKTEPKELSKALNIFRETVNIFFTKIITEHNQSRYSVLLKSK